MNSMDNEIVKDLNELLRGCHMGASTFKEYLVEAQSEKLRETLKHSLDIFQKHETELTSRINSYGEDAVDSTGIMAVLSEMTEKIKTMMADSDEEILNQSIKAMDMGLKACHDFIDKHKQVPEELLFVIHDLEADYKKVYRDLTELKLNNY